MTVKRIGIVAVLVALAGVLVVRWFEARIAGAAVWR